MKILHVMGMRSTKFGGLEQFLLALARADSSIQHVLAYNSMPRAIEQMKSSVKIVVLPTGGMKNVSKIPAFIKLILAERPDAVHFHFENSFALWSRIARLYGIRHIFKTEHSCLFANGHQAYRISDLSWKYRLMTFGKRAYKSIDKVFAVSKFVENQFKTVYGNNIDIETLYLGSDIPRHKVQRDEIRHRLGVKDNEVLISTILFANIIKGCDLLIDGFVKMNVGNAKLLIIGLNENAPFTAKINEMIKVANISERVINIGVTNNVSDYLAAADIYIQPSRTEALSLSCVEAASMSLPCVGSNVGGLPEIAGLTYDTTDTEAMSAILDKLCQNKDFRIQEGIKSKKRYDSTFTQATAVSRYLEIYNNYKAD